MKTTYIIMAAGGAKRWGNYLDCPKYLIEIDGETLLERTVRLLKQNGIFEDSIYITTDRDATEFPLGLRRCIYPAKNDTGTEHDKFINGFSLMHTGEEICFLYGDVFYTELAMETIVDEYPETVTPFTAFGRYGAFEQGGKKWGGGELFAMRVRDKSFFVNSVRKTMNRTERQYGTGWLVYRFMEKLPFDQHRTGDNFVHINDFTNDFDAPKDYNRWIKAWEHRGK